MRNDTMQYQYEIYIAVASICFLFAVILLICCIKKCCKQNQTNDDIESGLGYEDKKRRNRTVTPKFLSHLARSQIEPTFDQFLNEQRHLANEYWKMNKKDKADEIYLETATAIVRNNGIKRKDVDVDLHGVNVKELKVIVPYLLVEYRKSISFPFKIDCGKGIHSENQNPVLAPILRSLLMKNGFKDKFKQNEGIFLIYL